MTGMTDEAEIPTLKLSEVSKRCGVPVDVLRKLAGDRALHGVVRTSNGHITMREDSVPSWQQVVDLLEGQLRQRLDTAARAAKRLEVELEAIKNDIAMAIEDPRGPLGDDLATFFPRTQATTGFDLALNRLQDSALSIFIYHRALRETCAP